MKKILITCITLILNFSVCFAEDIEAILKDLYTIEKAWARPTLGKMKNTAIYMEIKNQSTTNDVLLSAKTDIAESTEIHKTIYENGISRMIQIDKLSIPAKNTIEFVPGGLHIMLMKVKNELNEGDNFPLVLQFQKAGIVTIEIPVLAINKAKLNK